MYISPESKVIAKRAVNQIPDFKAHCGLSLRDEQDIICIALTGSAGRGVADESSDADVIIVFNEKSYATHEGLHAMTKLHKEDVDLLLVKSADLIQSFSEDIRESYNFFLAYTFSAGILLWENPAYVEHYQHLKNMAVKSLEYRKINPEPYDLGAKKEQILAGINSRDSKVYMQAVYSLLPLIYESTGLWPYQVYDRPESIKKAKGKLPENMVQLILELKGAWSSEEKMVEKVFDFIKEWRSSPKASPMPILGVNHNPADFGI
jgi:predicted nucleotidyltransferase